jgi:ribosome assembly protein YihI (activator of Der GTPase)
MEKTPHEELERLENDQLRALLIEALRAMKEVELTLQGALDRDKK